ncbi:heat-inducible transcriptional repressor HrcA [Acidipila sp. EB88]|uniref:heat-inducible transcriptional repressor HrcA n=1 Tax=Acidipila sp. EB88 TaxID=2305226 RepID=UPI000F5FDC07|nr:heat-inducible transcriptional repressor HrcA [Acidipila sp. EB88]RRA48650.1 heat-inducible transcription repressor HrcA [Acidipila sp. EB88]
MLSTLRISPRERLVLLAIIEAYIVTGEPVASQALARLWVDRDGMSAATIRNVMASLGDAGLLDQAHSSAGRIPTPLAFRFYVEQLGSQPGAAPRGLSSAHRAEIEDSFSGVSSAHQFLERTSQVLASISSGLGIALLAASESHALEHIHFSRLGGGRVLAVLVTTAGVVLNRVLHLPREMEMAELDAAARYLNHNFRDWSVDRIRAELDARLTAEQSEYDRLLRSVEELCSGGALQHTGDSTLFIGGVANLLSSEMDRSMLRQMLSALEEKQRLATLLRAYVDARQQTVQVVVGLEADMPDLPELSNFVLIGAPTRLGSDHSGTLAVIAPTRVEYGKTIDAVAFIAQLSDRILQLPQP